MGLTHWAARSPITEDMPTPQIISASALSRLASTRWINSSHDRLKSLSNRIRPPAVSLPSPISIRVRVLDHEYDANVLHGWLVRGMHGLMTDVGLRDVKIDTCVVVFTPDLAANYFTETARSAKSAGVIDTRELDNWVAAIEERRQRDRLFCSIGYYLFTARI